MFEAMLDGQLFSGVEATYRHRDGGLIAVSVSSRSLRDAKAGQRDAPGWDITEQKRAAVALAQSGGGAAGSSRP
jgi:hypothetical protein